MSSFAIRRPVALALPVVGVASSIAIWALAWQADVIPKHSIASPAATARSLRALLSEGDFWTRLGQTGWSFLVGLVAAAVIAIPLGVLIGSSSLAFRMTRIVIEALRPIPPVVVLPLALLVLGLGLKFKVALIVQGAVWPLFIQTSYGIRAGDPVALETARSFHLGVVRQMFLVRIPGAALQIATGLRLAAATAFAVCLVTEIVGGAKGIGTEMIKAQIADDKARVMALTVVAGVFGMLIAFVFGRVERRVLRWAPSGQT